MSKFQICLEEASEIITDTGNTDSIDSQLLDLQESNKELSEFHSAVEGATDAGNKIEAISNVVSNVTMDESGAKIVDIAVESIYKRLGFKRKPKLALESFSNSIDLKVAVEDWRETYKKTIVFIQRLIKTIYNALKSFFIKLFNLNQSMSNKARMLLNKYNKCTGKLKNDSMEIPENLKYIYEELTHSENVNAFPLRGLNDVLGSLPKGYEFEHNFQTMTNDNEPIDHYRAMFTRFIHSLSSYKDSGLSTETQDIFVFKNEWYSDIIEVSVDKSFFDKSFSRSYPNISIVSTKKEQHTHTDDKPITVHVLPSKKIESILTGLTYYFDKNTDEQVAKKHIDKREEEYNKITSKASVIFDSQSSNDLARKFSFMAIHAIGLASNIQSKLYTLIISNNLKVYKDVLRLAELSLQQYETSLTADSIRDKENKKSAMDYAEAKKRAGF